MQLSEIAWILGYSDPSVFARAIRNCTDASPSEWSSKRARTH